MTEGLQQELDFLKTTNASLSKSLEDFLSLNSASQKILGADSRDGVIDALVDAIRKINPDGDVSLFLRNEDSAALEVVRSTAADPPDPPEPEMVTWIADQGKPTTLPAGENLQTFLPLLDRASLVGFATLNTTHLGAEGINKQLMDMLAVVTGHAAMALRNLDLVGQLEEQLHEVAVTRNHLNNILDSIHSGILTLDTDNTISLMNRNASAMLELDPEVSVGKHFNQVLPEKMAEMLGEQIHEVQDIGFSMERQFSHKQTGGLELHFALGPTLLRDENFQVVGTVVVLRDMTASKELERLRKLDQLKSEFVANVSHELKTPLTSIKAYSEALTDMVEDETAIDFLKVIDEESDRLLFLINDLLNIARIESGKLVLKMNLQPPQDMVEEIMKISKVQSAKHTVDVVYGEDLPAQVAYDKAKMKEVMINLVGNAIKYSPEGGTVTITMEIQEGNLKVSVKDEGIGIAKEDLPKVFEQFFRVDSSLTAEIGGTGLGLNITQNIIEEHGGRMTVDSDLGVGTTFSFIMPMRTK
jgi:PAS domain S-box-containing protein